MRFIIAVILMFIVLFFFAKLQEITERLGRWITDVITPITEAGRFIPFHPPFPFQADKENHTPETQLDAHGNPYAFQSQRRSEQCGQ